MKRVVMAMALSLVAAASAYAVPAAPRAMEVHQDDGSTFTAVMRGDEYQHWVESTDTGHTVLFNRKSGRWEYAQQGADGDLEAANVKVEPGGRNAPSFLPRGLKPLRNSEQENLNRKGLEKMREERLQRGRPAASVQDSGGTATSPSTAAAPSSGWTMTPVSGSRKMLVILVNFSDRKLQTTPQQWYDAVFSTTAGAKSVANYYKDNSFGKLAIVPVSHTETGNPSGVVSVTLNMPHEYSGTAENSWVTAALNQAAQYVSFPSLDTDGDRYLERSEASIYFIVAGYEQSGSSKTPSVWAHATTYSAGGLSAAGMYFTVWARSGELNDASVQQGIGVIAHEMGHQMAGLPDLYDTAQKNAGLGAFSVMATGSWGAAPGESSGTTPVGMDAWCREYTGWSTPVVPPATQAVTLGNPLAAPGNTVKVSNPALSSSEYFLVENRRPQGWDLGMANLLGGSWSGGLLVEHVDNAMGTNASGATAHQGVVITQAAKPCDMMTSTTCYGRQQTFFYSGNNASLTASSTPSSDFYAGPSARTLTNVSVPGTTMSFTYGELTGSVSGSISINGGAQYTNTTAVTLGVSAAAPAPATVQQMSFSNDGVNWSAWETYATSKGWSLAAGADGIRTVSARFRDSAGNTSAAATASITLNTTSPVASVYLSGVSNGGTTRNTSVTFGVSNSGAAAYRYQLDGSAWSANIPPATRMTLSGLANGTHTLSLVVGDSAGNWQPASAPTTVKWTVDTVAPVTTATPPGGSYTGAQSVTLAGNESATIYYTTDGSTPSTASAKYAAPIAVSSSKTLKYFAVDVAGNVEAVKTATYTIGGTAATNTYTFTVSGTNVVSYKYSVDGGPLSAVYPVSQKIVLYNVPKGTHTLKVYTRSSYGTWSTTPSTYTWTVQ